MWTANSEFGKLEVAIVQNSTFHDYDCTVPFGSIEHPLFSWAPQAVYEKGAPQYLKLLEILDGFGVKTFELDKVIHSIMEGANASEKREIQQLLGWKSSQQITADDILYGHPTTPQYDQKRECVILPDVPRSSTWARDIAFMTQTGLGLSKMRLMRRREDPKVVELAARFNPELRANVSIFLKSSANTDSEAAIEGGDVQIINENAIAVGIGDRSNVLGVKWLLDELVKKDSGACIKKVIAVNLPVGYPPCMHLDTTINLVDANKAVVMPYVHESSQVPENVLPKKKTMLKLVEAFRMDLESKCRPLNGVPTVCSFQNAGTCVIYERKSGTWSRQERTSYVDWLIGESLLDEDGIICVGG